MFFGQLFFWFFGKILLRTAYKINAYICDDKRVFLGSNFFYDMRLIKDPIKRQEIIDAYFSYFDAYTKRHWEDMLSHLDEDITMFGTGIDEVGFKGEKTRKTLKREFAQAPKSIEYKVTSLEVFSLGKDAVLLMITLDLELFSKDQKIPYPNNRTTAIMVRESGRWKLFHGHWSQPDRDIDVGESVPYRLLLKRSKELEDKVAQRTKQIIAQKEELENLNQTKNKLFSVIAHDLKNPFNSIMGFSELLCKNLKQYDTEKVLAFIKTIHEQACVTYDLLENLLEWARSQTDSISFRPCRIALFKAAAKVSEHMQTIAGNKRIEISFDIPEGVMICADKHLLQIILRNLIHNAVKFTHEDGKVWVSAVEKSGWVHVTVADNGVGIHKDIIGHIFDGFSEKTIEGTANEVGTGLGLVLCKEFVLKHGGDLSVESREGEGSSFTFTLPSYCAEK